MRYPSGAAVLRSSGSGSSSGGGCGGGGSSSGSGTRNRSTAPRLALLAALALVRLPRAHAPHESLDQGAWSTTAATTPDWEKWAAPEPYRRPRQGNVVFDGYGCDRQLCSGVGCQDDVIIDECWTEGIVGCAELVKESVTCEYLSRCGPEMWYPAPCVETEVERWEVSSSPSPPPVIADDSCHWTRVNGHHVRMGNDGSCDEHGTHGYCTVGTDCTDCGTCAVAGARPGANVTWVPRPRDSAHIAHCGSQTALMPPIQARCHKTETRCNVCGRCAEGLYLSPGRKACFTNATNTEVELHKGMTERMFVGLIVLGILGLLGYIVVHPFIMKVLGYMWKHLKNCQLGAKEKIRVFLFGDEAPSPTSRKIQPTGGGGKQKQAATKIVLSGEEVAERKHMSAALALAKGDFKRPKGRSGYPEPLLDKQISDAAEAAQDEAIRKRGSPAAAKVVYSNTLTRLQEQKRMEAVERNGRAMRRMQQIVESSQRPVNPPLGGDGKQLKALPQLRDGALPSMGLLSLSPAQFSPATKGSRYDGLSSASRAP